jgi:hypothetical protein
MINDELLGLLEKLQVGDQALVNSHDEVLNLFLVMLSKTLEEADKEATKLEDGKSDHSLGTSQGFESGADWVIERIKEKLHSA